MRLLRRCDIGGYSLTQFNDDTTPSYAILSHTWGADAEEVTFDDINNDVDNDKPGYEKIQFCGEQAARDGLEWFWIDTCCINKSNKAELSQAIKSMFRWYQNATKCYVYLSDVSTVKRKTSGKIVHWESALRGSRWFTRGWTLQELLAPRSIDFFSRERKFLGSKISLTQQIHEITGIPKAAIRGARLSQFTIDERLLWIEHRQTKLAEDRAYSLLGLFNVYIAPLYGEGTEGAFRRLLDEVHKLNRCIQAIRLTDPRDDKRRIEDTKGGLVNGSYRWVLDHPNFHQWQCDLQSRLLWIKGDPGKGKTMLLCGIINEMKESRSHHLSFFFCQGTDSRINNATAVLRGLIYLLVDQHPSLSVHLRKRYDQSGKSIFEDANAWVAVSDVFTNMVHDPQLKAACLIVDALDECIADLPKLLDLIIYTSSSSSTHVKWLFSSRNEVSIEQKLKSVDTRARLSLELKQNAEQVSHAVNVYIDDKLSHIESLEDSDLRYQLRDTLRQKANGTFLWVALVVQELEKPETWDPLKVVEEAPTGLYELYDRMVNQIRQLSKRNSEICLLLLSIVSVAYRPLHLAEIGSLCGLSGQTTVMTGVSRKIVAMCGSFITIRDDQVYLIHQSAKDYLNEDVRAAVLQTQGKIHYHIFSQSLKLMSSVLKRDMYGLHALGFPAEKITVPALDPLAITRYSCTHWVDHLHAAVFSKTSTSSRCDQDLQDNCSVHTFLRERYLYWLEALSLCSNITKGVISMIKLESLLQGRADASQLTELVHDACRFIRYHKKGLESSPLQAYGSALLFSPTNSLIRRLFKHEEPGYITVRPAMGDRWSACVSTLEEHSKGVMSVAYSHDSKQLASASIDGTVKVWDVHSGGCMLTLKGHTDTVLSVAFSPDSTQIASGSTDETVKIWDTHSGECVLTLKGHNDPVLSVAFSHHSAWLVSVSDKTARVWNTSSGKSISTLKNYIDSVCLSALSHDATRLAWEAHQMFMIWDISSGDLTRSLDRADMRKSRFTSMAFSCDSLWLATGTSSGVIEILDISSGERLQTLHQRIHWISSLAFSHDSKRLASASDDCTISIWDVSSGECLSMLKAHTAAVVSLAFSPDSTQLVSASRDGTVKTWDTSIWEGLQMPEDNSRPVKFVVISPDSTLLALGSFDCTVYIWDVNNAKCLSMLEGHTGLINSIAFSHDSTRIASASGDATIKVWDVNSNKCLSTLKGHKRSIDSVAFSHDSTWLASVSYFEEIKIWDITSGECLQTLAGYGTPSHSVVSHDSLSGSMTIFWDANSNQWLSIPDIEKKLKKGEIVISFDSRKLYLYTDLGIFNISALSNPETVSTQPELQTFQPQTLSLSENGEWITHNSANLVWIPSEYRPRRSAVSGNIIAFGMRTGGVWICEVQRNMLDAQ
ncbi:hypothetical protein N0V90_010509 [Kalmusia sp. IMI 367209]|nr:hypothetical protein N0V90_010509 [Kalmusia sp. IMI 367209]